MRVLVTGGAGFIGSHLVDKLLVRGFDVVVVDNFLRGNKLTQQSIDAITLVEGDVRDAGLVGGLARGCDWIVHLAAYLGVDCVADNPVETMDTEAMGMKSVAGAAIANGVDKVIYASTSGIYGKAAIERAVDEEFLVSPSSSYSIAKRYNEIYLQSLHQEKNLQSLSLRYFNVFGPRQDARMVIPRFIEQALEGRPLSVYGDGAQSRDFTYIDDSVEATIRAAESIRGCEVINIANGRDVTVLELAKRIVELTGSNSEVHCLEPPLGRYDFEVQRRCGSSEKLKRLTGFTFATPFEDGLEHTCAHLAKTFVTPDAKSAAE
jgi:UDP-glucose 4-epimerase